MNTPGTFTELTVDPQNERAVIGRYVLQTGEVSTHRSLVAETYGPSAARRRTAVQIALGPEIISVLKEIAVIEGPCSLHRGVLTFQDGSTINLCQLINQYEGA